MSNLIPFPQPIVVENYDGGCPSCGKLDAFLNVCKTHWCVCHTHRTKWCIGENLYSSWRNETEQDWLENKYRLAGYREVEPLPCNILGERNSEGQP